MPLRAGYAQPGGGIALRVHVDEQDRHASDRKGSREIDRRRGLADAALLVRHSQYEWFGDDSPRMVMKGQSRDSQVITPFTANRNGRFRRSGASAEFGGCRRRRSGVIQGFRRRWRSQHNDVLGIGLGRGEDASYRDSGEGSGGRPNRS